jgi:hypothetical protein
VAGEQERASWPHVKLLLPGGMSKQRQGAASAGHAPLLQLAVCIAHKRNCSGKSLCAAVSAALVRGCGHGIESAQAGC